MVHDPMVALETLISLGFERVLTSGCDSSALEGLPLIKRLAEQVSTPHIHPLVCCSPRAEMLPTAQSSQPMSEET